MRFQLKHKQILPLFLGLLVVGAAQAATLGTTEHGVLPATTRQVISVDNHRLSADTTARNVEAQVLPPEMRNLNAVLTRGGINPDQDIDRLTFATFGDSNSIEMIGVADGNLQNFKLEHFFHKTAKQPHPPQYKGVDLYESGGLTFTLPDRTSIVFGSSSAVKKAIDVQQGLYPRLDSNNNLMDLISGTEPSDVWSVLDASGARAVVAELAANTGKVDTSTIAGHFNGARYTINFQSDVKVNLQLVTDDAATAAVVSTGLRAAVFYRQREERNPVLKDLLGNVQVDSAGDNAFLQVSSPENTVAQLLKTDLFAQITH